MALTFTKHLHSPSWTPRRPPGDGAGEGYAPRTSLWSSSKGPTPGTGLVGEARECMTAPPGRLCPQLRAPPGALGAAHQRAPLLRALQRAPQGKLVPSSLLSHQLPDCHGRGLHAPAPQSNHTVPRCEPQNFPTALGCFFHLKVLPAPLSQWQKGLVVSADLSGGPGPWCMPSEPWLSGRLSPPSTGPSLEIGQLLQGSTQAHSWGLRHRAESKGFSALGALVRTVMLVRTRGPHARPVPLTTRKQDRIGLLCLRLKSHY